MGVHFALGGCAVLSKACVGTLYANVLHNNVSIYVYTAQLVFILPSLLLLGSETKSTAFGTQTHQSISGIIDMVSRL